MSFIIARNETVRSKCTINLFIDFVLQYAICNYMILSVLVLILCKNDFNDKMKS